MPKAVAESRQRTIQLAAGGVVQSVPRKLGAWHGHEGLFVFAADGSAPSAAVQDVHAQYQQGHRDVNKQTAGADALHHLPRDNRADNRPPQRKPPTRCWRR